MNKVIQDGVKLVPVQCCVCDTANSIEVGQAFDFEYFSCPNEFKFNRCRKCENVYLNPRPDISEFNRIYPSNYYAFDFSEKSYGFVHKVRSRLEANRLLRYCKGIPDDARILDIGCGVGFHLGLLKQYGNKDWILEGLDLDQRVVDIANRNGLTVHCGAIEEMDLGEEQYDLVYTIQTIEHVAQPDEVFAAIYRILKPGGRLVVVTDNTDSLDFSLFKRRYWGGYHTPRHFNLFNRKALSKLGDKVGFELTDFQTIVTPVNWTYSVHNYLVDKKAPKWLSEQFTLKSTLSLGVFTIIDMIFKQVNKGGLLNAYFTKPNGYEKPAV